MTPPTEGVNGDPLSPSRGIALGALLGLVVWAAIAAAAWWWIR